MKIKQNIQRLSFILFSCMALIGLALGYWQVVQAGELVARRDNPRLIEQELKVQRGTIFDRTGKVLVDNKILDRGFVQRVYRQPSISAITGFVSPRFGPSGLEKTFDDVLSGKKAESPLDVIDDKVFHRPTVGSDLVLTLDMGLQQVAEQAMGKSNGAILVMNPKTGEILALVSNPTFDANQLVYDPMTDNAAQKEAGADAYWKGLNSDPLHPLVDRATQGLYAPGSTFKTVTLAAALESGTAEPTTQFHEDMKPANAQHSVPWHENDYVSCQNHTQADFDLAHAYAYSCNVVFSELGLQLGAPTYLDFARRFGLGTVPLTDIPSEASQISTDPQFFTGDERFYALAATAMGQGKLAVTPLQMALVASGIANGGSIPKPYLVSEIKDKEGKTIQKIAPSIWKSAVRATTAKMVKDIMVLGVDEGWASQTKIPGIKIAGKTGTAEVGGNSKPHSWFIGFAPADDPQVAVVVLKEYSGYGSEEAAPAAKTIFQAALQGKK